MSTLLIELTTFCTKDFQLKWEDLQREDSLQSKESLLALIETKCLCLSQEKAALKEETNKKKNKLLTSLKVVEFLCQFQLSERQEDKASPIAEMIKSQSYYIVKLDQKENDNKNLMTSVCPQTRGFYQNHMIKCPYDTEPQVAPSTWHWCVNVRVLV